MIFMGDELVLLEAKVKKKNKTIWDRYKCYCGKEFVACRSNIRSGVTSSCGCLKRKMVADKNKTHGLKYANDRLYRIWKAMRQRCNNCNSKAYKYYGAKGVSVCVEWNDYSSFYHWAINNGYNQQLTIDRKNPFGNYEPDNCRWIIHVEQARNKRDTLGWTKVKEVREKYNNGISIKELSIIFNVNRSCIKQLLNDDSYTNNFIRNRSGRIYEKKKVALTDKTGKIIQCFKSLDEAASLLNIPKLSIQQCAFGRIKKTHKQYYFKYIAA